MRMGHPGLRCLLGHVAAHQLGNYVVGTVDRHPRRSEDAAATGQATDRRAGRHRGAADRAAGSLASSSPLAWTARSRSCSGWQAVGFGAAELDDQRPERLSAHDRCGGVAVESAGGQTQPAAALAAGTSFTRRSGAPLGAGLSVTHRPIRAGQGRALVPGPAGRPFWPPADRKQPPHGGQHSATPGGLAGGVVPELGAIR
jgi:hypothetical protein